MEPSLSSVLIVGCAGGRVSKAVRQKFDQLWAINKCFGCAKVTPDLVLAIDDFRRDDAAEPGYVDDLMKGHDAPVMTTIAYEDWPRAVAYPLAEVLELLGMPDEIGRRLLDNSINFALALAMSRGAEHIGMHGVCFSPRDRPGEIEWIAESDWKNRNYHGDQRPEWFKWHGKMALMYRAPQEPGIEACHFLLGMAMERGIKLSFYESSLLNLDRESYFYGYSRQPEV